MVHVYRQKGEHASISGGVDSVARMVGVRPSIGAMSHATVRQQIQDTFIRVTLRSQKNKVFQSMRQTVIIMGFRG